MMTFAPSIKYLGSHGRFSRIYSIYLMQLNLTLIYGVGDVLILSGLSCCLQPFIYRYPYSNIIHQSPLVSCYPFLGIIAPATLAGYGMLF